MEEYYLICEDSLEGIFTGIYEAYRLKKPHQQIHLCLGGEDNYRLFASDMNCEASPEKAAKVAGTIMREFGKEAYLSICRALASPDEEKAEAIYKTVVAGFQMKDKKQLMGNLANPYVRKVFELARFTANEAHFHVEFLRFRELENGILYAPMGPKNNLITFIVPHFADRLPLENFVIHDDVRNIFAMHPSGKDWYLVSGEKSLKENHFQTSYRSSTAGESAVCGGIEMKQIAHRFSEGEEKYSELFSHFFHTIAIKERESYGRQRNMLPLRYREYMTEFIKN